MRLILNPAVFVGYVFLLLQLVLRDGPRLPGIRLSVIGLNPGCPHKPYKYADHGTEHHRFDSPFGLSVLQS